MMMIYQRKLLFINIFFHLLVIGTKDNCPENSKWNDKVFPCQPGCVGFYISCGPDPEYRSACQCKEGLFISLNRTSCVPIDECQ